MQKASPYFRLMRLHQPVGIWLVYWPCVWALLLAGNADPLLFLIFFAAAVVMRSAGCIVNDMADREFDRQVERTKNRPLASGELTMKQAFILLALLCVLALGALFGVLWKLPDTANAEDLLLIALPVIVLIVAYPFMKRITWWPQAFLGLAFNWGVFIAWFVATGSLSPAAFMLYAACFFWTLGYDTIYGHQDKNDDRKIGVKSTSLKLGNHSKLWVSGFYMSMLVLFAIATHLSDSIYASFIPLLILALALFVQVKKVDLNQPESCLSAFKSNAWFGIPHLATALIIAVNT